MSTRAIWVTRESTTVRHVRGLLEGLEAADVLDYAEVKIMAISDDRGVTLPDGRVFTLDNLPAQGIVFIADD